MTAVGADARVQTDGALPQKLASQVRKVPGVREVTGVRVDPGQQVMNASTPFDLLVVDPEPYARLVAATGLGSSFPAGKLDARHRGPSPRSPRRWWRGRSSTASATRAASDPRSDRSWCASWARRTPRRHPPTTSS
ncbi:hypothetical protein E4K10_43615 [Streptomyces sp. T1317-0309]|nr:hypothetical protein E4K10_43615 [Streptomyces sp. T1317-0309]